jgi:hypothetical protein
MAATFRIPAEIQQGLASVIRTAACNTLKTLFSVDAIYCVSKTNVSSPRTGDNFLCKAALLHNSQVCMTIFLSFDAGMLRQLLSDTYSEEMLENRAVFMDAASEIANIVGCNVKAFLNGLGYNLKMEVPSSHTGPIDHDEILLHFTMENEQFMIDYEPPQHAVGNIRF